MITWAELLKNRTPMPRLRNDAQMLKIRKAVLTKYPDATLVDAGPQLWKLRWNNQDISNPHNSHYDCWMEAYKLMQQMP